MFIEKEFLWIIFNIQVCTVSCKLMRGVGEGDNDIVWCCCSFEFDSIVVVIVVIVNENDQPRNMLCIFCAELTFCILRFRYTAIV